MEMILPRKLITPSTHAGESGTAVISGTRTISWTRSMGTPKVSRPTRNPTICWSLTKWVLLTQTCRETSGITMLELKAPDLTAFQSVAAVAVQNKAVHMLQKIASHLGH